MKILLLLVSVLLPSGNAAVVDNDCLCDVSRSGLIADCEFRNLTAVPDCVPTAVEFLLVSGNPLELNNETFHRFHNLKHIIMRKVNKINTPLPVDLFLGNPSIHSISLGWNHLITLPNDIFANIHQLKNLDLWANELTEIPQAVLSVKTLEILTLDRNKIQTLDVHVLTPLSSLKRLSLRRNPLCCDCALKPVYQWAEERNVTHVISAQCDQPELLRGRTLLYAFSSMDCEQPNDLSLNFNLI